MDFTNPETFSDLEEQAIDGTLNYDDFPPNEYKYFSKLSKLGYHNRHSGWTKETCEALQEELYAEYCEHKAHSFEELSKRIQENLRKAETLVTEIYFAKSKEDILTQALTVIECLTNENGFKNRIEKKIADFYT